ncbi:MAG: TOBE domain-containing protein [Burkholderiales bacterium]|nr:TOBE domain-containing protein [Burkholderiales bacterium]
MNRLSGQITCIETQGSVAVVDVAVGSLQLTATVLGNPGLWAGWQRGQAVQLLFKETEVALAKNLGGQISLRNRLPARIAAIEWGQLLTRVQLQLEQMAGAGISSVITTRSARKLQLEVGDSVEGLVKSNEMSLLAGTSAGEPA